ncbi:DUF2336 domain-containing protein [Brevundimonas basaltis]|uniref:Uncharacterized protein (DUF2336 family) n=1 Tax=Brevundimonas basaltis TaxID=472166 RepID=A0A7W8HV94_9CAUL|nr:DUF2336 domain-containing protein [Brevundimonas basaltis]MBB5290576.1 uncharacterized protein (DUF2336 family) [Brevundimonas basaltis]
MTVAQLRSPPLASPPAIPDLLALARNPSSEARERLLLGVIALCDARPPSGELSPVLTEIFLTLAKQAEREVRKVLSQRLAQADWAPPALINVLALDEIEIARPVLAASPLLQDDDLLRVLVEATLEHQIEIARRPNLGGRVADAIIDRGEPATVTALAFNRTAEISLEGLRRLVEQSRRVAALRGPLTRHPRMTEQLAAQMYQWVGAALRQSICDRFQVDETKLAPLIEQSVYDARSGTLVAIPANDPDRDEMERRLVTKLQASGQLRAGYLVRAIRERRLGLFVYALAALGGFSVAHIREALAARSPEALFYACAAAGVDRAVYPALLTEIRLLNDGLPGDAGAPVWTRGSISATSAARSFRALVEG